ncbi:POTRA domain-containing protein [Seonamhaeicola sediminis]|uniref:POTRA domain-containing protein n=1 Tax=Seonamhaeicola sediminis TaxID=2528206 RepID=UPI002101DF37|nr:POTRA domain-containing protein [Seonamhaeicola sediminis]
MKLNISGSSPKETQIIDSLNYLKNHKDILSIKTEINAVQKQLYRKGFIENRFDSIQQTKDSVFNAKFQLKKRFNTIHIYYENDVVSKSVLKQISKDVFNDYFKLKFTETENALNFINSKISEQGFPFSKIKLSNIKTKDQNKLNAKLIIANNSNKRTINNIIVKGYEKFPEAYLKHFLKIKPSQIFDLNKIKTKTEQLQNLRFASEVKPPEILFSNDSTTLYLYLKKNQSNSFDGFLGFGTNEETNKIEFDGYLNLNLTNNLNFGESFSLLYKSDENDQKTFQTSLTLPYLFKSPIGLDLSLYIFKKDSSFTTVNQSVKLHYQINAKHKISSGVLFEESNNLLNNNSFTAISDYKKNFISFSYQFTKPQNNNTLFPINSYVHLETNFGNRKETSQKEKQSLFQMNAFNIFNLNDKNSLYIRTNGAVIYSNSYFENELLRFGGINSIRGFEENSLFASLYGLINTEYRFQLNNSIYLHSVIDAAYFENKTSNLSQKLFSYGFGFGILTKSGLFKLNYANGKRENEQFKLSNSKVHISLTTIF